MSFAEPLPQGADLLQRLRTETQDAHRRLEDGLDILAEPLSQDRFIHVLERFWGFHAAWEPALARTLGDDAFLAPRSKLAHLERDLYALGRANSHLPLCLDAARLAQDPHAALGSLYVLEGSTLGGQVITRILQTVPWLPQGGLTYFHPYGAQTGEMWRGFRTYAANHSAPHTDDAVVAGAQSTFELLLQWLV